MWEDLNGNGRQDIGEPGIDGVSVELLDASGNVLATTTTAGGAYSFTNLVDSATFGSYRVRFGDTAGGVTYNRTTQTSPVATGATDSDAAVAGGTTGNLSVPSGAFNNDVDAGLHRLISLGDRVWYDANDDGVQGAGEPGIAGATVTVVWLGEDGAPGGGDDLTFTTTTTGPDGIWSVTNLPPGNFTVTVSNLPNGLTSATYDLDSGTANADGTTGVTTQSGRGRTDVDFGYRGTGSLGDRVWYDRNGNRAQDPGETGLNGVTVRLTWADVDGDFATTADNYVTTALTSGDGDYLFDNLPAGQYRVDVLGGIPVGYQPTYDLDAVATPNTARASLAGGQARTDVDFGYADLSSFSGYVYQDTDNDGVRDAGERAIVGVTIRLTGTDVNGNAVDLTTTTDATGFYRFADLITGTYTVTEVQPRAFLDGRDTPGTPGLAGVTLGNDSFRAFVLPAGTDAENYNFGELPGSTSLRGFVYVDRNKDGVKQSNEPGIGGGVVRLTGRDDLGRRVVKTVVTDANGRYRFIQMRPGRYTLTELHPAAFIDGRDRKGSLGGAAGNDVVRQIFIAPGQAGVLYNFGEIGLTSAAVSKRNYLTLPNGGIAAAPPGTGVTKVTKFNGTGGGTLGN